MKVLSAAKRWGGLVGGAVAVVALDQITKAAVVAHFGGREGSGQSVIPGFFDLVYVRNPGGAFSMLRDVKPDWLRLAFFVVVTIIAIAVVVSLARRATNMLTIVALSLLLGGAFGNLIDRVLVGTVCDFLLFYRGEWKFPAFNVADIAINVGVGLLLLEAFLTRNEPAEAAPGS